jgi:hypothetical protein
VLEGRREKPKCLFSSTVTPASRVIEVQDRCRRPPDGGQSFKLIASTSGGFAVSERCKGQIMIGLKVHPKPR